LKVFYLEWGVMGISKLLIQLRIRKKEKKKRMIPKMLLKNATKKR